MRLLLSFGLSDVGMKDGWPSAISYALGHEASLAYNPVCSSCFLKNSSMSLREISGIAELQYEYSVH